MSEQPNLPNIPEQVEDLTPYDQFIEHQKWRDVIQIHDSELLNNELFLEAAPYMDDIHRKLAFDAEYRMRQKGSSKMARTTHHQIAMIIRRYMPTVLAAGKTELGAKLEQAANQADKIEARARQLSEELQRERSRGNVKFVESLTPPGNR